MAGGGDRAGNWSCVHIPTSMRVNMKGVIKLVKRSTKMLPFILKIRWDFMTWMLCVHQINKEEPL